MQNNNYIPDFCILWYKTHVPFFRNAKPPFLRRPRVMFKCAIVAAIQNSIEATCTMVAPVFRQVGREKVCEDDVWATGVSERAVKICKFFVLSDAAAFIA
jgi:hypothetical protein